MQANSGRLPLLLLPLLLVAPSRGGAQEATPGSPLSLQPGDVLKITVWREPDLSGQFQIDERGEVTLPMLGSGPVIGRPFEAVRDSLITAYRRELNNPAIDIAPFRRINVLGEVARPGLYLVDPTVSLAGAIAMAGGVTQFGDMQKIRINRGDRIISERIGPGRTLEAAGIRSGDEILVQQRSWLSRNSTFVISFLLSATSVIIALVR